MIAVFIKLIVINAIIYGPMLWAELYCNLNARHAWFGCITTGMVSFAATAIMAGVGSIVSAAYLASTLSNSESAMQRKRRQTAKLVLLCAVLALMLCAWIIFFG